MMKKLVFFILFPFNSNCGPDNQYINQLLIEKHIEIANEMQQLIREGELYDDYYWFLNGKRACLCELFQKLNPAVIPQPDD